MKISKHNLDQRKYYHPPFLFLPGPINIQLNKSEIPTFYSQIFKRLKNHTFDVNSYFNLKLKSLYLQYNLGFVDSCSNLGQIAMNLRKGNLKQ